MASLREPSRFLGLLALVGLAILVDQLGMIAASTYPFTADNLQWRYSAFGLVIARVGPLLTADALLVAWAVLANHRVALRVLAVVHAVVALLVLVGLGVFVLDAIQVRPLLPLPSRRPALLTAARTAVMGTVVVAVLGWIAVRLFAGSRSTGPAPRSGQQPLIVNPGSNP